MTKLKSLKGKDGMTGKHECLKTMVSLTKIRVEFNTVNGSCFTSMPFHLYVCLYNHKITSKKNWHEARFGSARLIIQR